MKFKIMFQRLLESRIELRPVLNNSHRRLKDMLFLDLALAFQLSKQLWKGTHKSTFFKPTRDYVLHFLGVKKFMPINS